MGDAGDIDNVKIEIGDPSDIEHLMVEMSNAADDILQLTVEPNQAPQLNKRNRKKSVVWEHFTLGDESNGCKRACCDHCKGTFAYTDGTRVSGTSHLKRHLARSCPVLNKRVKKQPRGGRRGGLDVMFDNELSSRYLAKMIVLHDYPLYMVEQPGVLAFVRSLQPRFKMPSLGEIDTEILALYHKGKKNLVEMLRALPGKINVTAGFWTTNQSLEYVCLTGQFIDSDWKLHRRMLNFTIVCSENVISEVIEVCLSEWNMSSKLFTVTLENGENPRNGNVFVVRCYAHILNAIAHDLIASIYGIVYKVRESVKFVKVSPAREDNFASIALALEIPSTKSLSIDVATQWNTTYHMLAAALEYKEAFVALGSSDDNYNVAPTSEEWKKVDIVCTYLKLLHESAHAIMSTAEPTANIFFQEAWKIQMELTYGIAREDALKDVHEKFDEYWKDCSLVLAVAVAMDPRFKMKLVKFSYSKIYGEEDAAAHVKIVKDTIHAHFLEYVSGDNNAIQAGDELLDFDMYLYKMGLTRSSISELDQYLEEALVPRDQEFDILSWWKLNSIKYPNLSKMARDVLAIPISTVNAGCSIFEAGTGRKVLDDYRSSIRPEIVEALFCAKDWFQYLPLSDVSDEF